MNFAFIWHSIYWGVITLVVLIWGLMIIISPLFGRIGCGWICFMGAICAGGATYSRLIPIKDPRKCDFCARCERDCLVRIPMVDYVKKNSEC